jgi:hypothetical protein
MIKQKRRTLPSRKRPGQRFAPPKPWQQWRTPLGLSRGLDSGKAKPAEWLWPDAWRRRRCQEACKLRAEPKPQQAESPRPPRDAPSPADKEHRSCRRPGRVQQPPRRHLGTHGHAEDRSLPTAKLPKDTLAPAKAAARKAAEQAIDVDSGKPDRGKKEEEERRKTVPTPQRRKLEGKVKNRPRALSLPPHGPAIDSVRCPRIGQTGQEVGQRDSRHAGIGKGTKPRYCRGHALWYTKVA